MDKAPDWLPERVLLCAATARELEVCGAAAYLQRQHRTRLIPAVTGVGIPMTLARLMPLAAEHKPDLIVNVGIAGAYPGSGLDIGDLVLGSFEVFGDIGMELPGEEAFQPLASMPWADAVYHEPMALDTRLFALFRGVTLKPRLARGCTVNACTGREETGRRRRRLFAADFESMEGAAVALTGKMLGIPVCELRSISNLASLRDMRPENVDKALRHLGAYMKAWLKELHAPS